MLHNLLHYIRHNWVKLYFVLALSLLVFIYGFSVGKFKVFPHSKLMGAWSTAKHLVQRTTLEPRGLNPILYENSGVSVYKKGQAWEGVTLIGGPWKEGDDWFPGLRLIDMNGSVVHQWTIDPKLLWEESPHDDPIRGSRNKKTHTYIHGVVLFPNGEVVFNLSHYALVKLNACSEIVWKLPYRTHHSVDTDEFGNFWVSGERWHNEPQEQFPGLSTPFIEDTVLKISPDGEILREFSVLESIYRSGYEGLLFVAGPETRRDITHMNDVEVLSTDLADDFKGLEAGDIMVSLRNINSVIIFDGETEDVKWVSTHPFIRQHDPDFIADGYITVYDNRMNPKSGNAPKFGGSRIVKVKPFSNEVEVVFSTRPGNTFYSDAAGKHQYLPNGNLMLIETLSGRVFEITSDGELVWNWVADPWDENRVPEYHVGRVTH